MDGFRQLEWILKESGVKEVIPFSFPLFQDPPGHLLHDGRRKIGALLHASLSL